MNSEEIKNTFIEFFKKNDHLEIPNSSLVPEHDPTLLFINSGMAPLKNYFIGQTTPPRARLTNIQRCLRTEDLEDVGHNRRTLTFFEMLGSWSIDGYGKNEAIHLAYNLLVGGFKLDPARLYATVFNGDKYAEFDTESFEAWQQVGLPEDHIIPRPAEDNFWWSGPTGPCGPCTEVLYDLGVECVSQENSIPGEDSERFLEIWNAGVFMQYDRLADGVLEPLPIFSVDTGAGLERLAMVVQNVPSVFETDRMISMIQAIEKIADVKYDRDGASAVHFRIIADHIRAIVFALSDGIIPSNNDRGYVVRRLIRRAIMAGKSLDINGYFLDQLSQDVYAQYADEYQILSLHRDQVSEIITTEEHKFNEILSSGQKTMQSLITPGLEKLPGDIAFKLYDTHGLPLSAIMVLATSADMSVDVDGFNQRLREQQERSRESGRQAKEAMASLGEEVAKNHTAAHLLNEALRRVISSDIAQAGQDLNAERLRFDFTFPRALTPEELKQVEDEVNSQIKKGLPVEARTTTFEEAKSLGAQALFAEKYKSVDDVVLYTIGDYSKELCGGPHVTSTSQIKEFKILKQESVGQGVRRIRARAV